VLSALTQLIREDHEIWRKYADIEGLGSDHGTRIIETYHDVLDKLEADVFEGLNLPPALKKQLHKTVAYMFEKPGPCPVASGIVVAGMGDSEMFPVLLQYDVGPFAAGKLRIAKKNQVRVGQDATGAVVPFAQRATIDMILDGIHESLQDKLIEDLVDGSRFVPTMKDKNAFKEYVREELRTTYHAPLMRSVSALPRQDLAKMAEALVSLTAFLMRMSSAEQETVAGPIDVAVLSKGDGFVWVKRKDLVRGSGALGDVAFLN
jgi:hypothetical protein